MSETSETLQFVTYFMRGLITGEFPRIISRGLCHKTASPLFVVVTGCRIAAITVDLTPVMTRFFPLAIPEFDCSIREFGEVLEQDIRCANNRAMITNWKDLLVCGFIMSICDSVCFRGLYNILLSFHSKRLKRPEHTFLYMHALN